MSTERENLLVEANELGLEFPKNISTKKLTALVSEEKGEPIPIEEEVPDSPAMKPEIKEAEEKEETTNKKVSVALSAHTKKRMKIKEAKTKAFKKTVVTLTNKDKRENEVTTTAYLSFENQYFGLSKVVPLDMPVELEAVLINIAENTMMTLHKDEVKGGKRTGNKVAVRTKKYAISYGKPTE